MKYNLPRRKSFRLSVLCFSNIAITWFEKKSNKITWRSKTYMWSGRIIANIFKFKNNEWDQISNRAWINIMRAHTSALNRCVLRRLRETVGLSLAPLPSPQRFIPSRSPRLRYRDRSRDVSSGKWLCCHYCWTSQRRIEFRCRTTCKRAGVPWPGYNHRTLKRKMFQ